LTELGFKHIEQAARFSHAKELLEKQNFNIVITEQLPPEVDGLALLKLVRERENTSNSAVLIISASLDQHTVVEAVKGGVSEFIVKPFSLKTFRERLQRAISLPVKSQSSTVNKPSDGQNTEHKDLNQTSILVVDDVPDNIKVVSEVIRQDYQVRAATSGEKALKICLSKNPPDMLLLDIMMPDMDGLTLCKKLKSHPLTQHITIIFISAMDQTDDVVRGLELGAVDYITKPINPKILAARVKTHVKIAHAQKTLREQVDLMVDYAQLRSDFDRAIQKDIKRPIKALSDNLLKLEVYYDEPKKVRETTAVMKEVCTTANNYSDNLALLDKLENQKYDFTPMPVNLVDAAKTTIDSLRAMATARGVSLQLEDKGLHIIQAEESMVRMTLLNLTKNALEASTAGQTVSLEFSSQGKSHLCQIHNNSVVAAPVASRFFDKYSSYNKPEGSGLGTYIAKLLTEAQGGNIWFETSSESGTTVYLQYQKA